MKAIVTLGFLAIVLIISARDTLSTEPDKMGHFNKESDLYLAHFDSKTDVDDVESVAAIATILADQRFDGVTYHAVAGAYGIQTGLYVPANDLFEMAFGSHWSDAHADFDKALDEVSHLATEVLHNGGRIWIAEGGQSDFSAALIRRIQKRMPDLNLKNTVNIIQHGGWNEEVTSPEDLAYVKEVISYHRIPDGNSVGNGTPGFRTNEEIDWRQSISDPRLKAIWERAIIIAEEYNGAEGRYLNEAIMSGGLDFSDVCETTWIFGFNELKDVNDFFREFAH